MPDSEQKKFPGIIPDRVKETNKQILSQTLGFISSAFVLVAALAWNEAIKATITRYFPAGSGIVSLLIYALVVTIIAVLVTSYLSKLAGKDKTDEHPK